MNEGRVIVGFSLRHEYEKINFDFRLCLLLFICSVKLIYLPLTGSSEYCIS